MRKRSYRSMILALLALVAVLGCAQQGLPEPESRGAQLYVAYCSGSGCHDPIPPQRDSIGYWNNQYERMIKEFNAPNNLLPSPEEEQEILAYLRKHAAR